MKGISLPINVIVIIAIAVLVLVVLSAFFIGGFQDPVNEIELQQAMSAGCANLKQLYQCNENAVNTVYIPGFDPKGEGRECTLSTACALKAYSNVRECAQACGCFVISDGNAAGLSGGCRQPPQIKTTT